MSRLPSLRAHFGLLVLVGLVTLAALAPVAGAGVRAPADARGAARERVYAFINSACVTCRKEAPRIARWVRRNRDRRDITAVGFRETAREARAFARTLGIRGVPVVGDPRGRLARRLGVPEPPYVAFVRGSDVRLVHYSRLR